MPCTWRRASLGLVVRSRNPPKLSSSELDVAASICVRQSRPNSKQKGVALPGRRRSGFL